MKKTLFVMLFAVTGCAPKATPPAATPTPAPAAAAATPPELRLPPGVRPSRYRAKLTVVPGEPRFQGTLAIDLELAKPASLIWLDAVGLDVHDASLSAGDRTIAATATPAGKEFLAVSLREPAPAGIATLTLHYDGTISDDEVQGLFHQKEVEDYAFTQFEELGARRVFPCFDEPSFKTPWQLTLEVKKDAVAISNTPEKSRTELAGGMVSIAFEETRPLPSYLVAFAVGPFDVVDAGRTARGVPVRIVTPKGHAAEASFIAKTEPAVVDHLEDWFGIPFPYPKLDLVAIPSFPGAMENAGMITSSQLGMLQKPGDETARFHRSVVSLFLHETAHQWFGDLVTTAWWDDIWLNEAFANWMDTHVQISWKPEWQPAEGFVAGRDGVMHEDSLTTARKIRQPIESDDDIENAFDSITYDKGEAVLYMVEAWVGPDLFRKGVHDYLLAHADGNATTPEFLAALSAAAGKDVAPVVSSFADATGLPVVGAKLACDHGRIPVLHLTQKRFLPVGSTGSEAQTWKVPVCVRYDSHRACTLLETPEADLALTDAASCPKTIVVNDRATGYFRVSYDPPLRDALLAGGGKSLFPEERVELLDDLSGAAFAGKLPLQETLSRLAPFASDPDRRVTNSVIGLVSGLSESRMVPDEMRPNFSRWVRKLFGARARALGFHPKPGESEDDRLLRPVLVSLVADDGEDAALQKEAADLAKKWLDAREKPGATPVVEEDLTGTVLGLAAIHGDRALFDRLREAAKGTNDLRERHRLDAAIMSFRDPALFGEALGSLLADDVPAYERTQMLFAPFGDRHNWPAFYAFVREHYDALAGALPSDQRSTLVWVGFQICDRQARADYQSFFQDRAAKLDGGPRDFAQVLESIDLCAARKDAEQPGVIAFLKGY